MKWSFTSKHERQARGGNYREPLRTLNELAESLGTTPLRIAPYMKGPGAPKARSKNATQGRRYYSPTEFMRWWRELQVRLGNEEGVQKVIEIEKGIPVPPIYRGEGKPLNPVRLALQNLDFGESFVAPTKQVQNAVAAERKEQPGALFVTRRVDDENSRVWKLDPKLDTKH